mgnify:CR=1 FL=1
MKKNVLITGGAGFIGSHLAELLVVKPEYNVIIVDNLSSGSLDNVPEGVEFIKLDICDKAVAEVFQKYAIDTVVHLAAQTAVGYSIEHPDEDAQLNILGSINIMDCSVKYGVQNFIFASSAAVYGDGVALPIVESAQTLPSSFYGLTKLTWEKYMAIYSNLHGIKANVLRFANVYGPRQGDKGEGGVISIFAKCVRDNIPLNIFGSGEQTRDFIYVQDVARAIVECVERPAQYDVFNVSTKKQTSVLQLVAELESLAGRKLQVNFLPAKPGDILHSSLDNSKITAGGLVLDTELKTGLSATLNSILKK